MATPKRTRIAIVLIAVMMVAGTIGSFAVIVLAEQNRGIDNQRYEEAMAQWQKDQQEFNARQQAQADELSEKYYETFSQYQSRVSGYDKDSIKELATTDLKEGDGEVIDGATKFATYYIGWNSDGTVFDGSIENENLKSPLRIDDGLDQASLIEGWIQGMKDMKIGGVRELAIPSDLAYGETGSGDNIPPNMPIKFVVMAIELPEEIQQPELPDALLRNING